MASDADDAERWWDALEPSRKVQIHRWISPPQSEEVPGQIALGIDEGKFDVD